MEPFGDLVGSQSPRICTRSLGELTEETSPQGFACLAWMRAHGFDPLPWQETLTKAIFERHPERPDRYRFRTCVVILPRQNGKSEWASAVLGFRLATGDAELAVNAAQNRVVAHEMLLRGARLLGVTMREGPNGRRYAASGNERIELSNGARWLVETMNSEAGRGYAVDALWMDELRHAHSEAQGFAALEPTTSARPRGMLLVTSNAGTKDSAVLNGLIERGRTAAQDPEYSGSLGLWEWSGQSHVALDDRSAWVQANPSLGYSLDPEVLENALRTSSPNTFRTERLSILVATVESAIDSAAWAECADATGTLDFARGRLALAVDTSPDGHTSMCAAGMGTGGTVRVELVAAWASPAEARTQLATLIDKIKPRKVAYFSTSPTTALAQDIRAAAGDRVVKLSDPSAVCAEFGSLVLGRNQLTHGGQSLLDSHIEGASKLQRGQGWVFARRAHDAPVDAAYAAAAAVNVARTLPAPGTGRLVVAA